MSLLALVSCSDDLGVQTGASVREGIPTQVKLTFKAESRKNVEVTRAGKEGDNEVRGLYVFIFNGEGNLKTAQYDEETFTDEKTYSINTTSGDSYILAVANVALGRAPAEYNTTELKTALDAAVNRTVDKSDNPFTLSELKALKVSYRRANVGVIDRIQSTFMMSGKYVNTNGQDLGDGRCTIPENGALAGEIQLYRTDAEVIFNVSIGDDVKRPTSGATITPSFELTSYRVVNIPRTTYVMNNAEDWDGSDAATAPSEANYYTMSEDNAQEDWNDMADGSKQFIIYLMENRKKAKEGATDMAGYNDRERQEKTPTGEEGKVTNDDWTYAPERGTYVVLRGIFRGYDYASYDDEGRPQGALVPVEGREVQYKIHLGNFSNNQWSNFETKRNTSYTYNVKVNGVENIVVEVLTDEENQPGATGDIFFTNNTNIYELDAHYETCLLRFTKSMLAGITGGNAPTYRVSTPFSISNEEDNPTYKSQDANWVRFAINERSRYGQQNYSEDLRSYASNGGGCASDSPSGATTTYREGDLLTVDQLMAVLGELQNNPNDERWDNNGEFLVTCFVNEFYYTNDTEELGYEADNLEGSQYAVPEGANVQANVPLWKYCVNQPDRTLHLLCDIHASADGESNIIDAAYVISQKSIQTFYNTSPSITDLTSCMGLETVNETRSADGDVYLTMGTPVNNSRDYRDGLTNTLYMWGFLRNVEENEKGTWVGTNNGWSDYIDYANNGYKNIDDETYIGMNSSYRKAYIACMQRNRDVNRDGRITEDEIKWYMPAVNQLGAMYIGEGALSTESRLMPDNSTWEITHYYSSTYKSDEKASSAVYNKDDGYVITVWAEEGFSISDANSTEQWRRDNDNVLPNPVRYHYRCVRNVGNIERSREGQSYLNTTRRPQNYWTLNDHTVDFTYLNSNATRSTAASDELSVHNQFDVENRVYTKMEYAADDAGMLSDRNVHGSSNISLCRTKHGQGWRVPNQRELMFLTLNGVNQAANVTGLITDFPTYDRDARQYLGYYARTRFKWYTTTGNVNRSPFDGRVRYGFEVIGGARGVGNSGNLSLTTASVAGNGNYSNYWGATQNIRCVRDVE